MPGFYLEIRNKNVTLVMSSFGLKKFARCFYGGLFNVDNFYLEGNVNVTIFDISKTVNHEKL